MREIEEQLAREYARLREQAQRERDARYAEAIRLDPAIEALQSRLQSQFDRSVRCVLKDPGSAQELTQSMRETVKRVHAELAQRQRALGLEEDAFDVRYRCAQCKDTGFSDEPGGRICDCYRLRRSQLMWERARLTGGSDQTFETFDPSVFPEGEQREQAESAKTLCARYADRLLEPGKLNLLLMGKSGLGKTFLLNCVANRALKMGIPVMPVSAFSMLGAMREYHFGQTGEDAALRQLIHTDLLLIDDLGSEPMLRNITTEYLFMLLNERVNRKLHTVIATNLSPVDLLERYNERVVSRIMDRSMGELIRLIGKDLRFRE